ncbi:2og-fe alamin adenosyltransferase, partial [Globisporangium polare]
MGRGVNETSAPVLNVPVIDIGALMACQDDEQVDATLRDPAGPFLDTIAALRAAASEWGFFYITNHGITSQQLEALQHSVRAFFALPADVKNRIRRRQDNARGYFDGELTKNKPDWKEVFDLTGPHEDAPPNAELYQRIANDQNQWLDEDTLPGFKQTIAEHFDGARHIARRLLNLFAVALGEKTDFFDQFFPNTTPEDIASGKKQRFSTSTMRLNHYPVAPDPESTMGVYHHTDPGA